MLGRVIGSNFRLEAVIGLGAMGTIYRAEQLSLRKTVVIKLLHRHLHEDDELGKRFHREAHAAALLDHPACIRIIDFGQSDEGLAYIAMEHVGGMDLADLLHEQHPLGPKRIVRILTQVCQALDEAHANGVLHRDLKPENIMVFDRRSEADAVKVLDFGIAKLSDQLPNAPNTFKTVAGVVCGTPEYMSPEQARDDKLDGRTDLYALGIILYQLLTNTLPFDADTSLAIVTKQLAEPPQPPSRRAPAEDIPKDLEDLCLELLSKDRRRRPQTPLEVAERLDSVARRLRSGEPAPRPEVDRSASHATQRPRSGASRRARRGRGTRSARLPGLAISLDAPEPLRGSGQFRRDTEGKVARPVPWAVKALAALAVVGVGVFVGLTLGSSGEPIEASTAAAGPAQGPEGRSAGAGEPSGAGAKEDPPADAARAGGLQAGSPGPSTANPGSR